MYNVNNALSSQHMEVISPVQSWKLQDRHIGKLHQMSMAEQGPEPQLLFADPTSKQNVSTYLNLMHNSVSLIN